MVQVSVKDDIRAPASRVWSLIRDFGNVGWMQGVERAEVDGQGAGMVRSIYASGGPPVRERLESCDDAAMRIGYTVVEGNPLPIKDYQAAVTVVDTGAGGSRLEWAGRFTAAGASEAEAEAMVRNIYGLLVGWVKAAAEKP